MGVTLIGVLDIIGGLFFLLGGFALFALIPFLASHPEEFDMHSNPFVIQLLTGALGYALAGAIIALGIADMAIGIGLLKGKKWAWKIAVFLVFISFAGDIISMVFQPNTSNLAGSIVGIIIEGVILYYLYRPHVKEYFGKLIPSGTAQPASES